MIYFHLHFSQSKDRSSKYTHQSKPRYYQSITIVMEDVGLVNRRDQLHFGGKGHVTDCATISFCSVSWPETLPGNLDEPTDTLDIKLNRFDITDPLPRTLQSELPWMTRYTLGTHHSKKTTFIDLKQLNWAHGRRWHGECWSVGYCGGRV